MNAAKIADQISVDVDPHIIVAGEVVGHPCCSVLTGESAILLGKLSAHRKTKVVMERRARSFNAAVCKTAPRINQHIVGIVEQEELSSARIIVSVAHRPVVIYIEVSSIALFNEFSEILLRVIYVVTVLINLEKALHVGVRLLGIINVVQIEQIGKGLSAVGAATNHRGISAERWIAIGAQDGIYNAELRIGTALICSN